MKTHERRAHGLGGARRERQPTRAQVALDDVLEPGLVDRDLALLGAPRSWLRPCRRRRPARRTRRSRRPSRGRRSRTRPRRRSWPQLPVEGACLAKCSTVRRSPSCRSIAGSNPSSSRARDRSATLARTSPARARQVTRLDANARDAADRLPELVQGRAAPGRDVDHRARRALGIRREQIRADGVLHEGEVARLLAIAEDRGALSGESRADEARNHRCVLALRILPRPEDVEVAQARRSRGGTSACRGGSRARRRASGARRARADSRPSSRAWAAPRRRRRPTKRPRTRRGARPPGAPPRARAACHRRSRRGCAPARRRRAAPTASAAWWNTTSTPAAARASACSSRTSPRSSSTPSPTSARFASRPLDRSSSTRTFQPSATSPATRWLPMKPAPPVTNAWRAPRARAHQASRSQATKRSMPVSNGTRGVQPSARARGRHVGPGARHVAGLARPPVDLRLDPERLLELLHHLEHASPCGPRRSSGSRSRDRGRARAPARRRGRRRR